MDVLDVRILKCTREGRSRGPKSNRLLKLVLSDTETKSDIFWEKMQQANDEQLKNIYLTRSNHKTKERK